MVNIKDFYVLEDVYIALAVMSFFVFGLLLLRIFFRTPRGLIMASFISYAIVLINILDYVFKVPFPPILIIPCLWIGMRPSFLITAFIVTLFVGGPSFFLKEGWLGTSVMYIVDHEFWCDRVVNLLAFSINTLLIFAIIRLILYIKHKVSAKKTQVK